MRKLIKREKKRKLKLMEGKLKKHKERYDHTAPI
jgi:hypothetical protein